MLLNLPREIFDAPLNACQMRIETSEPDSLIKWKSLEDYKRNAHKNFAKSQIKVVLTHSMPWFSHYVVIFNKRRKDLKTDSVMLKLKKGVNEIEVYPVNSFGREGMSSKAIIRFVNKYKSVKSYW